MSKAKTYNLFSLASMRELQRDVANYEKNIQKKCREYVTRLANIGIEVAEANKGRFSNHIAFKVEYEDDRYGCTAIIYGTDVDKLISTWQTLDGTKQAEVSPILMAEFGSGFKAQNPNNVEGYGQGTFPDQTHAFDEDGWSWKDVDGNWHHSKGIEPTMPMYKAGLEIKSNIKKIGKEIFGNG